VIFLLPEEPKASNMPAKDIPASLDWFIQTLLRQVF
jgi:hypothetical protein